MLSKSERFALRLSVPSVLGFVSEALLILSFQRGFRGWTHHFYWLFVYGPAALLVASFLCILVGPITALCSFFYIPSHSREIRLGIRLLCWIVNVAWFLTAIWQFFTIDPMPRQ